MKIYQLNGWWVCESEITVYGKRKRLYGYAVEKEYAIKNYEFALANSEIVYHQTYQMHKEIAAGENKKEGDWPEEMKEKSRKWLLDDSFASN